MLDPATGAVERRLGGVGTKSHGLVFWEGSIVMLDSDGGALLRVHPAAGNATRLWATPQRDRYLKGLAVVDDVAFFGIAQRSPREDRASPDLNCTLAAFDLRAGVLLWRRRLPTRGLLNLVAAPHLSVESTAHGGATAPANAYRSSAGYAAVLEAARAAAAAGGEGRQQQQQEEGDEDGEDAEQGQHAPVTAPVTGPVVPSISEASPLPSDDPLAEFPPQIGGRWASGLPHLDLAIKAGRHRGNGFVGGVQLLLMRADIAALRVRREAGRGAGVEMFARGGLLRAAGRHPAAAWPCTTIL